MLSEDFSIFFNTAEFASVVVAGGVTGTGILDAPTVGIGAGMNLSDDYRLTVQTGVFGTLKYGDAVTVDGVTYTVREPRQMDDGKITEITLSKT